MTLRELPATHQIEVCIWCNDNATAEHDHTHPYGINPADIPPSVQLVVWQPAGRVIPLSFSPCEGCGLPAPGPRWAHAVVPLAHAHAG